ncbi:hypothetical protein ACRDE1_004278 [Cronobacter sakazakii]
MLEGFLVLILGIILNIAFNLRKRKMAAAYNIQLAKFTYENEDLKTRSLIQERAKDIVSKGTSEQHMERIFNGNNQLVIFGFYALAMNELGITPALKGFDEWLTVRNPFIADTNFEKYLVKAKNKIESKTGVNYDHWLH